MILKTANTPKIIRSKVYLFLQYSDTVGWVFRPVKTVSHITYTVLVGT